MIRNEIRRPIRILHAVGRMGRAGAETWLMHILRRIDRRQFAMDFLVHTLQPQDYDDEIRALGSRIIPCLNPHRPWSFARNFKRVLREHGPYDIVHSHIQHYGGWIVRSARQAGVPVRVVHSHLDTSPVRAEAGLLRRSYFAASERWINRSATLGLAASEKAAAALFGPHWKSDPRWSILHYGIELAPFRTAPFGTAPFGTEVQPDAVRKELGIPKGTFVVGHVGRFAKQKNHTFLLEIAAEIARREPEMCLLLVGDGPLRSAVEQQAAHLGLGDRVIFAGVRADVPRLMRGAMDVLLMPSFCEGLPLVGIEAQAAGLPSVISDVITEELNVVKPLFQRLPLTKPASIWAEAVLHSKRNTSICSPDESLATVERSSLNVDRSVRQLEAFYVEACRARTAA